MKETIIVMTVVVIAFVSITVGLIVLNKNSLSFISNDEVIVEVEKCKEAGMDYFIRHNWQYRIKGVNCERQEKVIEQGG